MKKKLVWVASGPNNIYLNFFDGLLKVQEEYEPILIVGEPKHNDDTRVKYNIEKEFEIHRLPVKYGWEIILFLPFIIKNILMHRPYHTDLPTLIQLKGLKNKLDEIKPDVLISTAHFKPYTWTAFRYCKKNNIPFILQNETKGYPDNIFLKYMSKLSNIISYNLFRKANAIISWSNNAVDFERRHFRVKPENVFCVTPGVDINKFNPIRTTSLNKRDPFKLLMVSRFVPYKRHLDLMKAFKYLKSSEMLPNVQLSFLGSGPTKKEIKNYIDKYNLGKDINFIPKVSQEKLKEIYADHHLLVLPSHNEELGAVVIEAMACGIPAIVSNTTGASTYIENGLSGYVFGVGNYLEMVLIICQINKHYNAIAPNVRKVAEKYSLEKSAKKLYDVVRYVYDSNN